MTNIFTLLDNITGYKISDDSYNLAREEVYQEGSGMLSINCTTNKDLHNLTDIFTHNNIYIYSSDLDTCILNILVDENDYTKDPNNDGFLTEHGECDESNDTIYPDTSVDAMAEFRIDENGIVIGGCPESQYIANMCEGAGHDGTDSNEEEEEEEEDEEEEEEDEDDFSTKCEDSCKCINCVKELNELSTRSLSV